MALGLMGGSIMGKRVADMTPEQAARRRERQREYVRTRYANDPEYRETRKAREAARYAANGEAIKAGQAAYRAANREKKAAYNAAYRAAKKDKIGAALFAGNDE